MTKTPEGGGMRDYESALNWQNYTDTLQRFDVALLRAKSLSETPPPDLSKEHIQAELQFLHGQAIAYFRIASRVLVSMINGSMILSGTSKKLVGELNERLLSMARYSGSTWGIKR